ncbi:hypothetical protein C8R43DRAFT_1140757 [Mycena crocata]|nr:hypothetical protein C8R43DRAFT_1140757 [Mycena crocata]
MPGLYRPCWLGSHSSRAGPQMLTLTIAGPADSEPYGACIYWLAGQCHAHTADLRRPISGLKAGGIACKHVNFVVAVPDDTVTYAWMEAAVTAAASRLPHDTVDLILPPVLADTVRNAHSCAGQVAIGAGPMTSSTINVQLVYRRSSTTSCRGCAIGRLNMHDAHQLSIFGGVTNANVLPGSADAIDEDTSSATYSRVLVVFDAAPAAPPAQ